MLSLHGLCVDSMVFYLILVLAKKLELSAGGTKRMLRVELGGS